MTMFNKVSGKLAKARYAWPSISDWKQVLTTIYWGHQAQFVLQVTAMVSRTILPTQGRSKVQCSANSNKRSWDFLFAFVVFNDRRHEMTISSAERKQQNHLIFSVIHFYVLTWRQKMNREMKQTECSVLQAEASVIWDLWGMWSTSLNLSLPGTSWPGEIVPDRIISMS